MTRNSTSDLPGSGLMTVKNADGSVKSTTNLSRSNAYVHIVERPDSQKSPPILGFRKPTVWSVIDHLKPLGYDGDFRYETPYSYPATTTTIIEGNTSAMYSPPLGTWDLPPLNDKSRAEIQALLKVKDMKVNAAVFLAEGKKSVVMIADRLHKLAQAAIAVKHGKPSDALRLLGYTKGAKSRNRASLHGTSKGFASDWLELQYGWLPLVDDIYGIYEAHRTKYPDIGYVFSGKKRIHYETETVTALPGSKSSMGNLYRLECLDTVKATTKVDLWYRVNSTALTKATSIGLVNPLPIAWELMPFSFLIDWVVPVGNWLEALDAAAGLDFLGGSCSRSVRCTRVTSVIPALATSSCAASATESYFRMQRTVYTTSPVPKLYYKSPISTMHALNGLALLRSVFGKR